MTPKASTAKDTATVTVHVLGVAKKEKAPLPAFLTKEVSPVLVAQVLHAYSRRQRIRRAHTKERAEVRGGGRKPWRQKGTGRSRHGSSRSPLWVGGGTTFGPRSRKERLSALPVNERRLALSGSLAMHADAGTLAMVRFPKELPGKTREVAKSFAGERGLLVIINQAHKDILLPIRNIPGVRTALADQVTAAAVAKAVSVWVDESALPILETRLGAIGKNRL